MGKRLLLLTIDGWGKSSFGITKKGVMEDAPLKFWREHVKVNSSFLLDSVGNLNDYEYLNTSEPQFGTQVIGTCQPLPIDEDVYSQGLAMNTFLKRMKDLPGISRERLHVFCTLSDDKKYYIDDIARWMPFFTQEKVFVHFFLDKLDSIDFLVKVEQSVEQRLNVYFGSVSGMNHVNNTSETHQSVFQQLCRGRNIKNQDPQEVENNDFRAKDESNHRTIDIDTMYGGKNKLHEYTKIVYSQHHEPGVAINKYTPKQPSRERQTSKNSLKKRDEEDSVISQCYKNKDKENYEGRKHKKHKDKNYLNIQDIKPELKELRNMAVVNPNKLPLPRKTNIVPISVDSLYLYINQNSKLGISDRDIPPYLFLPEACIFPLDPIVFMDYNIIDYLIFARRLQSINPCFTLHPYNTVNGLQTVIEYPQTHTNIFDYLQNNGLRSLVIAEDRYLFELRRFITGYNKPVGITTAFLSYEDFFEEYNLDKDKLIDWQVCLTKILQTKHDFYLLNFNFLMVKMETRPYSKSYEFVVWIDQIIQMLEALCKRMNIRLMVCGTSSSVEKCVYSATEGGDYRGELNADQIPFCIYDYAKERNDTFYDIGYKLFDVAPTLLDFFDIEKPKEFRGNSLLAPENRRTKGKIYK